jgi:alpha-galactosidase
MLPFLIPIALGVISNNKVQTPSHSEIVQLSSMDLSKAIQGWGSPSKDKSVGGNPITLDGHVYAHGFGTHAPGMLAVELNGGSKSFSATVGVDDEVPAGAGNVEFEVLGPKNRILWRSGVMHRGDPPKHVQLDVSKLKTILLVVTTAGKPYDFDHADWADAEFVVTGAMPRTISLQSEERTLPISTKPAPARPIINAPYKVGVYTGTPLIWTVPISGARPLSFSAEGLPSELRMNSSTGTITGTLTEPGNHSVLIIARNRAGEARHIVHIIAGDSIALTPPMGWNSYDAFGDDVTEAEVMANARYVHKYLQPYGWDTIVVDYRWYDPGASLAPNNPNGRAGADLAMDQYGRLLPAPNRFPSAKNGEGFKPLADEIHAMGLKFGIHIMRGIPRLAVQRNLPIEGSPYHATDAANTSDTCGWCPDMYGVRGDTPAGQAYYDSLFRLYASWGVDYVKMDDTSSPYHEDEIHAVHNAILKCGRSIVYSLSPGETPIEDGKDVASHANLWRVSGDFWDNWNSLDYEFTLAKRWLGYPGPGHWPDADMLPLGHISVSGRSVGPDRRTNFTKNEQETLLTLWCMLPSPLMLGANLPDNDPWTLALLTNPEVLAIDQDSLGEGAKPIAEDNDTEVWAKRLADGSLAVALFNRNFYSARVTADWQALGISGKYKVRNLWLRRNLGVFSGKYEADVPGHGALLLRFEKAK